MNKTKIDWVKNPDGSQGYTWNPITGCLNGCEYCYARRLANGRLKSRYLANSHLATMPLNEIRAKNIEYTDIYKAIASPFYPRAWFDRRESALESKKPKGIFVCDMSDLFGIGIPEYWTQHILTLIRLSPQHRFYLLTKQPQNLIKWSPFPDNCWVGVTLTGEETMANASLHLLNSFNAKVKFISFEPLLYKNKVWWLTDKLGEAGIKWVIIGSQTKPTVFPKIEWVSEIVEACDKAGIPVFLKDNLRALLNKGKVGWPLRQEMPDV